VKLHIKLQLSKLGIMKYLNRNSQKNPKVEKSRGLDPSVIKLMSSLRRVPKDELRQM